MRLVLACVLLASSVQAQEKLQNVIVRPGDTLWSIANTWLDDPARWDEILKHNKLPTADPTVALPGMTLRVPARLIKAGLRAAHLTFVVNKVTARARDTAAWKNVALGAELRRGDTLRTHEESRARVKMLDQEILSLEPDSMATIKPGEDSDMVLSRGSVFASKARVVVGGAKVTPKSADTRYSATVEPDLTARVEVYKGTATVSAQGHSVDVGAGMQTVVPPGLFPGKPEKVKLPMMLEIRAQEYASSLTTGGGFAPDPRPAPPPREPEGDITAVRSDIQVLKIGQPIKAYHVQAAAEFEFRKILFDKTYDEGERFQTEEVTLPPGAYWWRVSAVDLLGVEGRFNAPHYYTVRMKRGDGEGEILAEMLQIISPEENSEIGSDYARASGIMRDERLTLDINGVPVKVDENGSFSITVRVRYGRSSIVFTLTDPKGNQSHVTRHVLKL
ncbi:MAG: LysM peptidoglycan-binding domain-containing protein [Elusimicrobia bacterium]|nr:LysM peptidoglycan-binding domain-containing protein [Elusimicrobiota bacterium]